MASVGVRLTDQLGCRTEARWCISINIRLLFVDAYRHALATRLAIATCALPPVAVDIEHSVGWKLNRSALATRLAIATCALPSVAVDIEHSVGWKLYCRARSANQAVAPITFMLTAKRISLGMGCYVASCVGWCSWLFVRRADRAELNWKARSARTKTG